LTLQEIIKELEYLEERAYLRSRMITEDGVDVPEIHRARSEGYACAYSFCLFRLKEFILERGDKS